MDGRVGLLSVLRHAVWSYTCIFLWPQFKREKNNQPLWFCREFPPAGFFSSENDAKTPSCCLFNGNNKHRKRVKILRKRAKLQQLKSVSGKTYCMKNKPRAGSGKNAHWAAFLPEIVRAKTRAFTKISYTYTCNLQPAIGSAWLEKIDWKALGLNFSVWRSSWADYPFQSESEQVLKRFLKTHTCMKPVLVGEVRSEQIVRVTSLCIWDNE